MPVSDRSHWTADESPLLLRSLPAEGKFELEKNGVTLALDHADDDPATDPDRQKGEILVREKNPDPRVRVLLTSGDDSVVMPQRAGLDEDSIERIGEFLKQRESADHLTVEVESGAITREEIGRLGHLADGQKIPIEVQLLGDG